ncbi:LOW QUALITY PROTEIN: sushi, von Willebrand factor type A, EGF and pentraxin domain-containing protein 1-like [Argopecten irradians]|uniref:LOW QUALITY PROTEIN: sushi, von Willebrand factor type A, EGF and pentraxin domain-containing protein 1-like n=1 Tax=Argopecten irradians TaxID=31199 RepID=UPI00371F21A5
MRSYGPAECLVIVVMLSGVYAAFSDIKRRGNSFCSLTTFSNVEKIICELDGENKEVSVTNSVPSGTTCVVIQEGRDRNIKCKIGIWYDLKEGEEKIRVKRWGRIRIRIRVRVGRSQRYSPPPPPPPPPNKAPVITCPAINNEYITDPRMKSTVVTWNSATATDPENNPITITQTHGLRSGSTFTEGTHYFSYTARDSYGNADSCTKQFTVTVQRCTYKPTRPTNGGVSCEPYWDDLVLGSTCTFTCDQGYTLSGSAVRTCQSGNTFDGSPTVCSKITCPTLPVPENGQAICTDGNSYRSTCMTSCPTHQGYGTVAVLIQCRQDGTWSGTLQPCYDFQAPYFTECPSSPVHVHAERGQTSAVVTWSPLKATDNSGNVTIVRTMGAESGSVFTVGSHPVNYVARDYSGNQSPVSCSFTVVVEQLECDPKNDLFDDGLIQVDCPGTEYIYGVECNITCARNYDLIGNTSLTCERDGTTDKGTWDWGGGIQPECNDKCPELTPPLNGALTCYSATNYYCRQSCNANYGYPRGVTPGKLYICTTNQVWDPIAVDDCTGQKVPISNIIAGEMHYFVGNCNDASVQEDLKKKFVTVLEDMVATGWNNVCAPSGCSVNGVTVTCGSVTGRKKKRSTDYFITIGFTLESPWQDNLDLDANDDILLAVFPLLEDEAAKPNGSFVYGGLTPSPTIVHDPLPMITCRPHETPSYADGSPNCEGCATGKYFDTTVNDCVECPIGTYQDESHQITCKPCPSDMSTKETRRKNVTECFQVCNAGTYSSNGVIPCTSCTIGTYQSDKHSTECTNCSEGTTTVSRGATSSAACVGFDVIFASSGTNITFSSLTSSLNAFSMMIWLRCPTGNVIKPSVHLVNGMATEELLQVVDSHTLGFLGSPIQAELGSWTHVTVRWDEATGQAELLISGQHTASFTVTGNIVTAGTSVQISTGIGDIADCRMSGFWMTGTKRSDAEIQGDVQTCSPQSTNAIYNMDNFKGKEGIVMDIPSKCDAVDECASNPCGVHECENLLNTYNCTCIGGYTGRHCDIPPDFCLDNACQNGAVCQNQDWNYTCQCVGDYKGEFCEEITVHGQWTVWSDWSTCNASCNTGQQMRIRTCSSPPPGPDGNDCSGDDQEIRQCNSEQCPSCISIERLLLSVWKAVPDHCVSETDYTRCNLTCEAGYEFAPSNQPLEYYECGSNTSYNWNGKPPSCGRIYGGKSHTVRTSARYTAALTCGTSTDAALQAIAGNAQCRRNNTCDAFVTTDTCGKRRRRRTTGTTVDMSFVFDLENIGDLNLTAFIESNIISSELQTYLNILSESDDTADQINSTSEAFFSVVINGNTYSIDPDSVVIETHTACDNGSIDDDGGCVECPPGTRQDGTWCVFCDLGTYQSKPGQVICHQCPTGYTTEFVGMLHEGNCSITVLTTKIATSSATSTISATTTTTSGLSETAMILICLLSVLGILITILIGGALIYRPRKAVCPHPPPEFQSRTKLI